MANYFKLRLSEVGSFHLEYYDLAFATGDKFWYDRAMGIRQIIKTLRSTDGLYPNHMSKPERSGINGTWRVYPTTNQMSFGAQGDSFYEYLLKVRVENS